MGQQTHSPPALNRPRAQTHHPAIFGNQTRESAVQVPWIPALRKDTRARNTHSSTAIEGDPLTLEEVRALEEGTPEDAPARPRPEVLNYFAALRHVEKLAAKKRVTHEDRPLPPPMRRPPPAGEVARRLNPWFHSAPSIRQCGRGPATR